jgi:hypothetical protein
VTANNTQRKTEENNNIIYSIQLILEKMNIMETSITEITEKVNNLEGRRKGSAQSSSL